MDLGYIIWMCIKLCYNSGIDMHAYMPDQGQAFKESTGT